MIDELRKQEQAGPRLVRYSIVISDSFEALHCWPEAPTEVFFLRELHRHLFKVSMKIWVTHADRQVEFFMCLKDLSKVRNAMIKQRLTNCVPRLGCEEMAAVLGQGMIELGYKVDYCSVSEDGENAGMVEFDYEQTA